MKKKKPLVGILFGQAATPDKAQSIASFFNSCPYCAICTTADCYILGILSFPEDHRWWFKSISEQPKQTVGLENAEVHFAAKIAMPSPWSSGAVKPTLNRPPCAADCLGCPAYRAKCDGCPATTHYLSKQAHELLQ